MDSTQRTPLTDPTAREQIDYAVTLQSVSAYGSATLSCTVQFWHGDDRIDAGRQHVTVPVPRVRLNDCSSIADWLRDVLVQAIEHL